MPRQHGTYYTVVSNNKGLWGFLQTLIIIRDDCDLLLMTLTLILSGAQAKPFANFQTVTTCDANQKALQSIDCSILRMVFRDLGKFEFLHTVLVCTLGYVE